MPNDIKKLDDGTFEVKLETGEVFKGDPMEVTTKLAEAQVNTKRWGQGFKQELETLKATPPSPVVPPTPPTPQAAEEAQLQGYLVEQTARGLGFKDAAAYRAKLANVLETTEEVRNNLVATNFMQQCPDFPNTPESISALSKKVESMGWDFSPQSMIAAHSVLVREHTSDATKGYAPLTPSQQNEAWAGQMAAANRQAPPPMLNSRAPDSQQGREDNPYAMKMEDLRQAAIKQALGQ
jgi:hypothetical protein